MKRLILIFLLLNLVLNAKAQAQSTTFYRGDLVFTNNLDG